MTEFLAWLFGHRSILLGFGAGALGFALLWGGWHLWDDHTALHQLIQIEIQRQQAFQRQQMQPQAPPSPARSGGG